MTKNAAQQLGKVLSFSYGTSRGRDTYGYTVVTLKVDGFKVAQCSGGGYDMKGTCLADWIEKAFPAELLALAKRRACSTRTADGKYLEHRSSFTRTYNVKGHTHTDTPNQHYNPKALYGLTFYENDGHASADGGCGWNSMVEIFKALGLGLQYKPTSKNDGVYIVVKATGK